MRPIQPIHLMLLPVLLSSCAIYAPDQRDDFSQHLSQQFSLYSDETPDTENRWWETFNSPELTDLIEEALTNSPTIQQAWARLAQAEALAAKAGTSRMPALNYAADATGQKNSTTYTTSKSYSAGLNASYEIDLWGRIKSVTEAAALDREASREQLNTAAITLAAQVTLRWSEIVSQKLQTEILRQQLESNKTSLELIELRFRKSQATALDVYQQRQTVAGTEAQIPQAELREKLLLNELAALLGRTDLQSPHVGENTLPSLGKLPALGIPADLLANRPDVRQAGLKLRAADWSVGAARADRLPAIRLTASGEYENARLADLFDDWYANLIGSLTGPIFEGGRRKAEVVRTRAVVDERLAAYREAVINAIKEVEDALISESKQHEYTIKLDEQLTASQRSYEESVNRYRNGLIEYTTVLRELNILQGLERTRVAAQYDLLQYRINLYRALGGSWPNELTYSKNEEM